LEALGGSVDPVVLLHISGVHASEDLFLVDEGGVGLWTHREVHILMESCNFGFL
jgi:hypothetical protein